MWDDEEQEVLDVLDLVKVKRARGGDEISLFRKQIEKLREQDLSVEGEEFCNTKQQTTLKKGMEQELFEVESVRGGTVVLCGILCWPILLCTSWQWVRWILESQSDETCRSENRGGAE